MKEIEDIHMKSLKVKHLRCFCFFRVYKLLELDVFYINMSLGIIDNLLYEC